MKETIEEVVKSLCERAKDTGTQPIEAMQLTQAALNAANAGAALTHVKK